MEKDKGMKYKIWIGVITAVMAVVMIRYYVRDFPGDIPTDTKLSWQERGRKEEAFEQETAPEEETAEQGTARTVEAAKQEKGREAETAEQETAPEEVLEQEGLGETEPLVQESVQPQIRVLIKTDSFESIFHQDPCVTSQGAFEVKEGKESKVFAGGEEYRFSGEDAVCIIPLEEEGLIICGLKRSQEQPVYEGNLELKQTENGVVVINQIPLEEYLPKVLSSEMSSAFPMEALKAQAICARTYAMKKMEENDNGYYGADLDDSVSYQVYNNRKEGPEIRRAVEETWGMVLKEETGEKLELADIYYYSTSCGVTGEDVFTSEEDFQEFITSTRSSDLEKNECWYRWQAELTSHQIQKNLIKMGYETAKAPQRIEVVGRKANGQAEQLEIDFFDGTREIIEGEYDIRRALAPADGKLILQDSSTCDGLGMLPSGWFVADQVSNRIGTDEEPAEDKEAGEEPVEDKDTGGDGEHTGDQKDTEEKTVVTGKASEQKFFRITGGGYGHGNGLSQNGARLMAEKGMDYREILNFYYPKRQIEAWNG